jgi:tripartite-type tricarboxylate transporter receptor subunit TctC
LRRIAACTPLAATPLRRAYPRRITIIVPYSPGRHSTPSRVAGQKTTERWGQPVVVDNKPGAAGTLGAELAATLRPTVTRWPPAARRKQCILGDQEPALRSDRELRAHRRLATNTVVLAVNPNVFPVNSLAELIAAVKAKPGYYNYSSPGVGTLQQLGMELFKQQLGLDVQHVPYRGQSQAVTDFIGGQVHMTFTAVNTILAHVRAGRLRIIASAGSKRSPIVPEIPTLTELGYPSIDFNLWFGFEAPANTPQPIVQMWEQELAAISKMPDARALERQDDANLYGRGRDKRLIKSEIAMAAASWKTGIKPRERSRLQLKPAVFQTCALRRYQRRDECLAASFTALVADTAA